MNQDKAIFDTLGDQLYALTCPFCGDASNPPDESKNPYLDTTVDVLRRIFPRLSLPITIDLIPVPPPPTP